MPDFICPDCGRKVTGFRIQYDVKTPKGVCPACGGRLVPEPEKPGLWDEAKPFLIAMAGGAAGGAAMRYLENRHRKDAGVPSREAELVRAFAEECAELSYRDPGSAEACALCGVAVALGKTALTARHRDMERRLPDHLRADAEARRQALLRECEARLRLRGPI